MYLSDQAESRKLATDPKRNCLDWHAHQVSWINSVRKSSGYIFEGWCVYFCYVFTYCWLLSWFTKLKLTPCTKLEDTKWKTSKTALKTDLQSWNNFPLAFLQLMYQSIWNLSKYFTLPMHLYWWSLQIVSFSKCKNFLLRLFCLPNPTVLAKEHTFDNLRKDGAMLEKPKAERNKPGVKFWICSFKLSLAWPRFVTHNFVDVPMLSSSFPVVGSPSPLSHSKLSSLQNKR